MNSIKRIILLLTGFVGFASTSLAQCFVIPPVPQDACYQQVIAADPFCCNTAWDFICQGAYDACVPPPPVGCAVVAPVPDDACYQNVIALDPDCCDLAWDVDCQNAYNNCNSTTYNCNGAPELFIVPPCITEITIVAEGGQGGGNLGGLGAEVTGTFPVTPGDTYVIYVGCQGGAGALSGGYPAGGSGQNSGIPLPSFGGGGVSYVTPAPANFNNSLIVAGGGGGTGSGDTPGAGGDAGCPNGAAGTTTFGFGGGGGTQVAGGTGGAPWTFGGGTGGNGGAPNGGAGAVDPGFGNNPGGGGGAGWFGGGGGGSDNIAGTFATGGGGGGGGSSLVPAGGGCAVSNTGDGSVTIAYGCETQLPTASNPPNINVQCAADVPAPDPLVVTDEADNCSAPTVAFLSDVSDNNTCPETITRSYTVTDVCLNQIIVTQTIIINDTQAPIFAAPPANVTVDCIGNVPAMTNLGWTDNCDGAGNVAGTDGALVGGNCGGTITRTWTYTDACGNNATVTQTITVDDNIAPTGTAPANVNVQCQADIPAPNAVLITDEADNCSVPVVTFVSDVSDNNSCPETITRTYSITDACGNVTNVQQIITVHDTQAAVFNAPPAAITYQCQGQVPGGPNLQYTDNCDAPGSVPAVDGPLVGGPCGGTITRTWTYTDACGNVATESQIITVNDTQPPTFPPAPAPVTVECAGDVPAMINMTWTDNCDGQGQVAGVDGPLVGGPCGGTITRTWTYTDNCGNTTSTTQTITIDDTTPPTATNPPTLNLAGGPAPAPDVNVVTDEADNCGVPVVALVSNVSDGGNCPETITHTYSVTDACGNSINVTQTIIIGDAFPPTGTAPADITVECIGDVPAADPLLITDEADNNGIPVVTHNGDVSDGNTCPEVITRTYDITDACGNVTQVTQLITVIDTQVPVFAAPPANVTVECIGDVPAMTNLGYTDNCDPAGNVAGTDGALVGGNCGGTITRTWTYTDACGNNATVTQTITVDDTTPPTATAPANVTVECIGDVPANDPLLITDEADNCDPAPVVAFVSDVSDGNTCPEIITRTYSITDACGNVTNVVQTITVDDTTPPTASNPPNINVGGGAAPAPDVNVVTDEADNCSIPVVAFVSDVSDGLNCPETITRTYSVTDACGNTINVTQLIIIGDAILPTASNPANLFVMCIGDVPAPDPLLVTDEADNGGVPVVAWDNDLSDGNTCPETITRTYSVTDNCGNVIYVSHDIVIQDLIPPSGTAPGPASYQCIADVPPGNPGMLTSATDNCTVNPAVAFIGDVSDGNTCPETILRSWTITDDCGNVTQVDQLITVNDTQAPTGTAPADVTVECIADVPVADPLLITDEADNCSAPLVAFVSDVSDGNTCPEVITRTYSITDACGNVTNVTQTITVDDTTLPTASNPAQTTVPGGPAPAPDVNVVIDEADNCGVPVVAFVSQVSDGNPCPETITYTYSVTDACGNTINVTHDVLITDPILPTATAPANINVECITAVPAPDPLLITDEADNNGVPTVTWASDVSDGNSCPETITRTYDVTDQCGNVIQVSHDIIVNDITPPTGTAPANVVVECIGDVPAADPLLITDEADNCGIPTVAFVGDVSDGNTCPETITRTYSITDSCGNSITVDQIITVDDITPPTGTAPADITVECIGDVPVADPLLITDEADNCPLPIVVAHVSDVSDGNTCPEVITRTYSITDACGNVTNVTQTITVDDTTLPTASNAAQTIIPGGPAPAPDPTVIIDEADNCTANPVVAFVSQVSDNNPCPESIIYTYSVTDDCGNTINVTHEVLITDPINPTGTAPADVTVECIGDVPAADPLLITDEADNNGVPIVAHVSDVSDGNTCPEVITRTYSITDLCGNQILVTQLITVNDITPPTASNPVAVNVECIGDVPAIDVTVVTDEADNCTAAPVVAHVSDVSDGNTCPETITRTYSVTDDCGNSINVTQTIIVDDITPPTASNPVAVNVECIGDVPAVDITVVTDEADNCPLPIVVAHVSDVSDGNTCPEVITRTYSVTDACGNTINVTQTITVDDITNPTASNPADIVQNGGVAPAPDVNVVTDEADNCPLPIVVAWVSDVSDNNPCPETIVRTYSVTDACGNQILVTQNIIINDAILPTGTAPADVNVECIGQVPAADPLLITDEADNQGVPVVAHVSDVSDGNTCPEVITRTYSITDVCGNQILVTQLITVNDITPPTASNPAPINVECIGDVPAVDITVVTDEADNCTAAPIVAHVSDVSDGNTCPETITRTYSVTDDCGNSINVTQTITVDDITPPTASNPVAVNVECIGDVPAVDITVVTDEADNCPLPIVVAHVSDVSDGNTCPEVISRTYSVTDACGNSINVTQTITVNDITPPTASNPAPINVSCASNVPAPDPTVVIDEADNCPLPIVVAHVNDVSDGNVCNNETITRTYSVTDACGNTINVTQQIVIGAFVPTVNAGVDQSVCEGTMVTLTATNPDGATISWDGGIIDGVAFTPNVGLTTYTVTADICAGECSNTDQVDVTVNPNPVINFLGDDLYGCEPHTVTFTNLSTEQGSCSWDFGDGNVLAGCGPVTNTYLSAGLYDVTLTVTSPFGCTSTDTYTDYVEVAPYPEAAFTFAPQDLDIMMTEVEFTNNSIYADTYEWNFGDFTPNVFDTDPTHTFPDQSGGSYTVTLLASSNAGCSDTATAVVIIDDVLIFYVPNTFTPDGNLINNDFTPIFSGGLDIYDYHLTIFNRWGEVVFESYNVAAGWNGHYGDGGLVQDGVYVWQLEFGETMSDKKHKHRGHVTVLK